MAGLPYWLRLSSENGFEIDPLTDQSTGIPCPRDNCGPVVYNGNYFARCGWAAEPDRPSSSASAMFNRRLETALADARRKTGKKVRQ